MTLTPTNFILVYLESHKDVTSAQICEAYSEHLGCDCNRANMTRRLKVLSDQHRIVRHGESGHFLYSGVDA